MSQIDQILKRISLFFHIFVALFILSFVYSFIVSIVEAASKPSISFEGAHYVTLIFILVLSLQLIVVAILTIVFFVKLLISIGKSISRRNIFCMNTVRLANHYAILNTALIFFYIVFCFVTSGYSNSYLDPHMYTELISSASAMVMLLMFAQVLKIGYLLKQEQDLTI